MPSFQPDIGKEQRLKAKVARKRRKRVIPTQVWARVRKSPDFPPALDGDPDATRRVEDAVGYDLYLNRNAQRARRARVARAHPQTDRGHLPTEELERAEVQARHFARLARSYGGKESKGLEGRVRRRKPHLQVFRDQFLSGDAVSMRTALSILRSPAAALLPASHFVSEIPLVSHKATLISEERHVHQGRFYEDFVVDVSWHGHRKRLAERWEVPERPERLWVLDEGSATALNVFEGTFFDELRLISERLLKRYGWNAAEASWFVLTDQPPPTPCLIMNNKIRMQDDHVHARVTLEVQPWVSSRTVAKAYRVMQLAALHAFRGDEGMSPQFHPTRMKSLKLFDFVSEGLSQGKTWRALMMEWNSKCPQRQRYDVNGERNFARDYGLIANRIVWLRWPKRPVRPARKKRGESA